MLVDIDRTLQLIGPAEVFAEWRISVGIDIFLARFLVLGVCAAFLYL